MSNINIQIDMVNRASMALIQNKIPIVKVLDITNESDQNYSDLKLQISSNPDGAIADEVNISQLNANQSLFIEKLLLKYSWDFFNSCSEKITGHIEFKLLDGDDLLFQDRKEIEFYPSTQWLGQSAPLEVLCSHIQPNSDSVQVLLKKASEYLKDQTEDSALNGYQTGKKKRVYQTSQAIFHAIKSQQISYAEPPASFEKTGQKVRSPDSILTHKLSTCLDTTLLFASCIEQAGLHSIVFLIKGHAFIGVWLEDKYMQRPFEEDSQYFRKRLQLDEILVFETTVATSSSESSFKKADELANNHFENDEAFQFGIDVSYCRKALSIVPQNEFAEVNLKYNESSNNDSSVMFEDKKIKEYEDVYVEPGRKSEVELWKEKLLDLSFRNRLLNFRSTSSVIKLNVPNSAEMEDILASGKEFELLPEPEITESEKERTDLKEVIKQKVSEGFSRNKIYTHLSSNKHKSIATSIFRSNRVAIEETGANTLFLALGMLEWTESDNSDKRRKSPLLLIPISLFKKSAGGKFRISLRDEDTVFNHTLAQKLYRDFGLKLLIPDPLPEDESGVDVDYIFDIIRKNIIDIPGWEVKEEAWISEFSFQKYLMWKELDESYGKMLESPVVHRVMEGEELEFDPPFVEESEIERHLSLDEVYCPLSSDSSQMSAIFSASEGKSFVLQGPPGSGKSQTITNMIAHCIGHGKRVLFVSEKKVALDVVYKRLKQIGLGPLCLELHSKKSEKKQVIKSFMDSLEYSSGYKSADWQDVSKEVEAKQNFLNEYFLNLHEADDSGITPFEAFRKTSNESKNLELSLGEDLKKFISKPIIKSVLKQVEDWLVNSDEFSENELAAWSSCYFSDWSIQIDTELKKKLPEFQSFLELLITRESEFPFEVSDEWSVEQWIRFQQIVDSIYKLKYFTSNVLTQSWTDLQTKLTRSIQEINEFLELENRIDSQCSRNILNANIVEIKDLNVKSKDGFIVLKVLNKFKLKKELKKFDAQIDNIDEIISLVEEIHQRKDVNISHHKAFEKFYGNEFEIGSKQSYLDELANMTKVLDESKGLFETVDSFIQFKSDLSKLLDNRDIYFTESKVKNNLFAVINCVNEVQRLSEWLVQHIKFDPSLLVKTPLEMKELTSNLAASINRFRDISNLNEVKNDLIKNGLIDLFNRLENGEVNRSNITEITEFSLYQTWVTQKLEDIPGFAKISGSKIDHVNEEYKVALEKYLNLSKYSLLTAAMKTKPKMDNNILPTSPLGLILHESKKSRKQMPIRKFLNEISSVSQSLKPCYLMSPLSVSQYLPVAPIFDLVIFDEASQIAPWDSIGTMARAKQCIVVGDSKQLPPTAFFSMSAEDDDEMMDCESVLEMFGNLFPELYLKWHYRSRSESLISFSNYHIYDNQLHTFPSSDTDDQRVNLEIVDGVYDRGASKTNKKEAETIVAEVIQRLKSKDSSKSIGVVTFSSPQAYLIEDLLENALMKNRDLNEYFNSSENDEYVFVKNLESVQGDERDVILFSVGYGKDQNGTINRNFGPLNNSGGERRLNVAVTRARCEVKIFSNFRAREFDVGTSKSEGLALLKEYLAFAEEGHAAIFKRQSVDLEDHFDSPFEEEVAKELRLRGYEVRTQIGVGGYRIDLGIVDEENPGSFLVGIECDGARYHSAKTARDRDILRQSVLEGLGWNILRIWSTDWWYDKSRCLDILEEKITNLPTEALIKELPEVDSENSSFENDADIDDDFQVVEVENLQTEQLRYNPSLNSVTNQGDFYSSANKLKIQLSELIHANTPIGVEETFTLIREAWGYSSKGKKMHGYLLDLISDFHIEKEKEDDFIWLKESDVKSFDDFRIPIDGKKRHPKSVAPQELANGLMEVLSINMQAKVDELYRIVHKKLGYAQLTKQTEPCYQEALEYLVSDGKAKIEGDLVRYCELS